MIDTVTEPYPDGPVADEMPDMGFQDAPPPCDSPDDCDDGDDCTGDSCVTGVCTYEQVPCGCCTVSTSPGCGNSTIEACVCALPGGSVCCDAAWDITCVEDVFNECGGDCGCCSAHTEPGCYDAAMGNAIADCVCAVNPFCCIRPPLGTGWDAACVDEVTNSMCGTCP
jgi:hypothetical protein